MHDIKVFIEQYDFVVENFKKRNLDALLIDEVLSLNEIRKKLITEVENTRAKVKSLSREIGTIKKSGGDAAELMTEVSDIKKSIEEKDKHLHDLQAELDLKLASIPNLVDESVPAGKVKKIILRLKNGERLKILILK